jgi:hypothetical protein
MDKKKFKKLGNSLPRSQKAKKQSPKKSAKELRTTRTVKIVIY